MRHKLLSSTLVFATLASGALIALQGRAADHNDSPGATATPTLDLTDLYLFRSPAADTNVVFVVNTHPFLTAAPSGDLFSNNARYQIHLDTDDSDLNDNKTLTMTFAGSGSAQTWQLEGLTTSAITGQVTYSGATPTIYDQNGIKVFAGLRDDPFFFDLGGFQGFVAAPHDLIPGNGLRPLGQVPSDFFAAKNVGAIVIEVPVTRLGLSGVTSTGGLLRAWASASRPS